MTTHPLWPDGCWLLLMQLYLRKLEGVKPMYSRGMVELALELHIPPRFIYARMFDLRRADTPGMVRLWQTYGDSPRRLARDVRMLRRMWGFSDAAAFYDGVEVQETFERDFRPTACCPWLKPVMLIMILDLYFCLTPATMTAVTPEIVELARLMRVKPGQVAEVMAVFLACNPYMRRGLSTDSPLLGHCREIWAHFGNGSPETLAALAAQLRDYFTCA